MSYPEVSSLTTLAYKGVVHFNQILQGKITLPACEDANENSATFFSASSHSHSFKGAMPIANWVIERHVILNPDDPQSQIIRHIVHDDTDLSPIQIFHGLRNWSYGAENVTHSAPIDHGQSPASALVLSHDAFSHLTSGRNIATQWQSINRKENGPEAQAKAPEAVPYDLG